jgi:hypothetical protein
MVVLHPPPPLPHVIPTNQVPSTKEWPYRKLYSGGVGGRVHKKFIPKYYFATNCCYMCVFWSSNIYKNECKIWGTFSVKFESYMHQTIIFRGYWIIVQSIFCHSIIIIIYESSYIIIKLIIWIKKFKLINFFFYPTTNILYPILLFTYFQPFSLLVSPRI